MIERRHPGDRQTVLNAALAPGLRRTSRGGHRSPGEARGTGVLPRIPPRSGRRGRRIRRDGNESRCTARTPGPKFLNLLRNPRWEASGTDTDFWACAGCQVLGLHLAELHAHVRAATEPADAHHHTEVAHVLESELRLRMHHELERDELELRATDSRST
ncbi:hypothetical protein ABT337_14980 [Saccharopolyspora hirsuta]|uniref:Uncharacterized protein n=1 Tax=Saccharopolyspora hirsuta TaxID=1837 RepID=A0A5M7C5D7_SACHI|nr:hypothetical protein [Saccharopolyspora hirsuta]KAA5837299.1 hypothetical protein F1721_05755 [Saccharopolyspora hirsuta]